MTETTVYILEDPTTLEYYNSRRQLVLLLLKQGDKVKRKATVKKMIHLDIWAHDNIFKKQRKGRIVKKRMKTIA